MRDNPTALLLCFFKQIFPVQRVRWATMKHRVQYRNKLSGCWSRCHQMQRQTGLVSRLCLWLPEEGDGSSALCGFKQCKHSMSRKWSSANIVWMPTVTAIWCYSVKYNKGLKHGIWKFNIIFSGCVKQQSSQQQSEKMTMLAMLLFTKNINSYSVYALYLCSLG